MALAVGLGVLGCGGGEASCDDPITCTCGPTRALPEGGCCPAWSVVDAGGVCRARSWTFPAPSQVLGDGPARRVSVSLDGRGRAILVWDEVGAQPGSDRIVVAEETNDGVSLRHPSLALPGFGAWGAVVAGEAGDAVVSWRQSLDGSLGDIHRSERSIDGTWIDPMKAEDRVSFAEKAYEPQLVTRPSGEIIQVWNQWYDDQHYGVAVARRSGPSAAWEGPSGENDVLSPPSFFSNGPLIALNTRGDALVSWYQSAGGELLAFTSERVGADGTFSRPGVEDSLSPPGAPVDSANPKPAVAEDGRAALAWTQETEGGPTVYLASRGADGTWDRPDGLDDSLCARKNGRSCRDVRAAFDSRGHLYVVWSQDDGAGPAVRLAQRAPDGTWVHPGERPLVLSTEGAAEALLPVLAVGRDGGVIVAWSERVGDRFRVAARRGSAAGFGWIEVLSPTNDHAFAPFLAIGGPADRAVVAWIHGEPSVGRVMRATLD